MCIVFLFIFKGVIEKVLYNRFKLYKGISFKVTGSI